MQQHPSVVPAVEPSVLDGMNLFLCSAHFEASDEKGSKGRSR